MATILRGFCTSLAVAGILAVSLSVGGCGALNSMGDAVGHGIASRMLAKHVGQPYGPIQYDSRYGKFIGEEKLAIAMLRFKQHDVGVGVQVRVTFHANVHP